MADLTALGSGTIEWRVVHKIGGADQALPLGNVLAYEDLHVKSDILLDKDEYRTGDQMRLTVRLRDDSEPIRKATVRVVLDAPDVGLGETLCSLGPKFVPKRRGEDPAAGKGALIEEVMRRNGWKRWPRSQPTGIFVDNTDELHDPDGDGNYTNTFAKVFKEGTYSWELLVDGEDAKGNRFDRRIIISTHAGVKVDPRTTTVQVTGITKHPSGLNAARVIIVPRDVRGERLGPGWDHAVIWTLEDGIFEQAWSKKPPAVFTDGTYQRVILQAGSEPGATGLRIRDSAAQDRCIGARRLGLRNRAGGYQDRSACRLSGRHRQEAFDCAASFYLPTLRLDQPPPQTKLAGTTTGCVSERSLATLSL